VRNETETKTTETTLKCFENVLELFQAYWLIIIIMKVVIQMPIQF